jgi:thioredoxin 1
VKNFLSFMLLTCAFTSVNAQTIENHAEEKLQHIFKNNYLSAQDNLDILHFLADQVLQENGSNLSADELIEQFRVVAAAPEVEQKYLSIYATHFDDQQREHVCELLNDERYMTYRRPLEIANMQCHDTTLELLQDLVKKTQPTPKKGEPLTQATHSNIEKLKKENFYLVIDVYADWCGPCRHLGPVLEEINAEYGAIYRFVKVNADKEEDLLDEWSVRSLPTLLFIKNGKEVGRQTGFANKEKILTNIKKYFD